ncbi:MAG: CvpA family protein [Candidatus Tumulicola sp.]
MIGGLGWPDIIIVLIVAAATFKGFSRGFVSELAGVVALAAALIAPWFYNGGADAQIAAYTKLAPGPAHVTGMVLTGIVAYVVILAIASILKRLARLPLLGTGNAIAGAAVGFMKGAILVWLALFVTQFFPLSAPILTSLKASRLVPYFTTFDGAVDTAIEAAIPPFARPLLEPLFVRHSL